MRYAAKQTHLFLYSIYFDINYTQIVTEMQSSFEWLWVKLIFLKYLHLFHFSTCAPYSRPS